jgi:hypothetical protein
MYDFSEPLINLTQINDLNFQLMQLGGLDNELQEPLQTKQEL